MHIPKAAPRFPEITVSAFLIFLIGFFLLPGDAQAAATKKLELTLARVVGENFQIQATLNFEGDGSGRTAVSLPMDWGGQKGFYKAISDIRCLNAGCRVSPADVPTAVFVDHQAGEAVTLTYTLSQDWSGPFTNEVRYRPHLADDYLFLIGHAFLLTPDHYQGHPIELTFQWRGLPGDWAKLTSFGTGTSFKTVVGDVDKLRSAIYTAGDYRVYGDEIFGVYTFIAVRGDWPFEESDFKKMTTDNIRNIRGFWNDYDTDRYLVTLIPIEGQCCSYGGTGLIDSFALFATEDKADLDQFEGLLAHELLHNWIGGELKLEGVEEHGYWFTEGFTNYYSRLLRLRGGQMTLEEYAADYNKTIADYYLSPARNGTLVEVQEKFWSDDAVQKLPYQQGDILAHNWSASSDGRRKGRSLDTVMKSLIALDGETRGEIPLALLDEIVEDALGRHILPDIKTYLEAGETLPLDPGALGGCFSLQEVPIAKYDRGFDYKESGKKDVFFFVESVNENHNAYKAGVRPGDEIVGYTLSGGGDVPLKLQIRRGDKIADIEYLPEGEKMNVPQYVLDENEYSKHPERCEAWFSGN